MFINELNEIDAYILEEKDTVPDQDADQDVQSEDKFIFKLSPELIKHLMQVINDRANVINDNERIYDKYKSSALAISAIELNVLKQALQPISNKELQEKALGVKAHHDHFKQYIEPLLQKEYLTRTIKDKPTSKYQQYITTAKGKRLLSVWNQIHENQK